MTKNTDITSSHGKIILMGNSLQAMTTLPQLGVVAKAIRDNPSQAALHELLAHKDKPLEICRLMMGRQMSM